MAHPIKTAMSVFSTLSLGVFTALYASMAYDSASVPAEPYAQGEVLITFHAGYAASSIETAQSIDNTLGSHQYTQQTYKNINSALIHSSGYTTEELVRKFNTLPSVASVSPNFINRLAADVNDTYYEGYQWNLNNTAQIGGTADADIDAPEAWGLEKGSKDVVVAVIDTGIDYTHEDLRHNMWDGRAYGLQYHGYDFASDSFGNNDDNPMPTLLHGTHVAGIIAAAANNIGVIGVAPNVSLMALKVFRSNGNAFDSDILEALNFISQKIDDGVNIVAINASYNNSGRSEVIRNAIAKLGRKGVVVCAAAGNNGADNDAIPTYPASYNLDNIIAVAATDRNDKFASFSNYGKNSVDIAAPGVDITSTIMHNTYDLQSGTSMAAPHVAGTVALLASYDAHSSMRQRIAAILQSAEPLESLYNKLHTSGRLNAHKALLHMQQEDNTTQDDTTVWITGAYGNNEDRNQTLSIAEATYLRVTVEGSLEQNYDFIYIYDAQGHQILQLDGSVNTTVVVAGNTIKARLVSDNSGTAAGVKVRIAAVQRGESSDNLTTWTTGRYGINDNRSQKLWIQDATRLKIHVKGETEAGYDYIYLYDKQGKQIAQLDGSINTTLEVDGDVITAKLVSDYAVVASGVTITIEAIGSADKKTHWATGAYGNDEDRSQTLFIRGATRLKVIITGETERYYDRFYIYDAHHNQVAQVNGIINQTLIVPGSQITARLVSDHFDTASGVSVSISAL
ncbi:MAG: hypothetical protein DSZ03_03115 [Sulfurimonas sp.]|nr:MAG: hypothetical protein DSZ03_03115 [Sulfurimonas sp.]